ncbi:MAG: cysteine peptidase family C39 domain-containing protein [Bacilli bacterium]|nr:cysteine peptidase family C39 domain-containing protein [Bacilli bacterium]
MKYFTYQGNSGDCGFAAMKMLLAESHKNKDYLRLKKPISKRRDYTIKDLIKIGEENGLLTKAFKYERKFDIIDKDSSKFLAIIKTEKDNNHVVMINKFTDYQLEIYDSESGIYEMEFENFLSVWTGYTIEIIEVQKTKFHLPRVNITNKLLKNYELIISLLSILMLVIGLFFLNDKTNIIIPLALLVGYSLMELVSRIFAIKQLQKVDSIYLKNLARIPTEEFESEYRNYNEFKKVHFTYKKNFVINLLIVGLIMVLLILNSPYHAAPLLVLLIVNIIDRFVLQKNNEKKRKQIDREEALLLKEPDSRNRYVMLDQIHKNTYNYVFNITARKLVYNFIVICCAVVMIMLQGVLSVNSLLFEFFMLNIYVEHLDQTIGFATEKDKYEKLLAHFIDTFVY